MILSKSARTLVTPSYHCLASIDIVLAIVYHTFGIIIQIVRKIFFNTSEKFCLTFVFLNLQSYNLSAWMLFTGIAWIKFIFIKYPLRYFRIVTLRRMVCLFAMSGAFSLNTVAILPFTNFPFTGLTNECSLLGFLSLRNTSNSLLPYVGMGVRFLAFPNILTVSLTFALISIAIKQSRLNHQIVALAVPGRDHSNGGRASAADREHNRLKIRGLLNVVYLVKIAFLSLVMSLVTEVTMATIMTIQHPRTHMHLHPGNGSF